MLGGLLALLSAATFAFNNASARRGVLTGTILQGLAITVPIGVPMFLIVALASGQFARLINFPPEAIRLMIVVGLLHFIVGRYCNYRAARAIGTNLSGPVIQFQLVVALALAIGVLGESLTPLRIIGIGLVVLGPLLVRQSDAKSPDERARIDASAAADADVGAGTPPPFRPRYGEGYLFAVLCACAYGVTPVMVRTAVGSEGPGASLVAGVVSYGAATVAIGLILAWPGRLRHVLSVKPESVKWFTYSGVFVCLSQIFIYMAYALAPVSVVVPIQQVSLVFRYLFSRMLTPHHEVSGGRMMLGIAVSLTGALALSISTELVLTLVPLPDFVVAAARWQWP